MCLRAELGARIADKTVLKMMREMGFRCGIRRETGYHKHNSYKGIVGEIFENVIGRDDNPSSAECSTPICDTTMRSGRKRSWDG